MSPGNGPQERTTEHLSWLVQFFFSVFVVCLFVTIIFETGRVLLCFNSQQEVFISYVPGIPGVHHYAQGVAG